MRIRKKVKMTALFNKILEFIRRIFFRDYYKKTPRKKRKPVEAVVSLKFAKYTNNPVISPNEENHWEAWQTFNPGVVQLDDDRIHFVYRAIGRDGLSRLGYANSSDGYEIQERHPEPIFSHNTIVSKYTVFSMESGGSWGGCEDPRLVRVEGEDVIYMTYTACDAGLRMALTSIKVQDFLDKVWNWTPPKLVSPPGEVHKNWVIFPEKINGKYAVLHSINPEISIEYLDNLEFKDSKYIISLYGGAKAPKDRWDNWIRGAGPPPIKTKEGWLLFYHAMDMRDPGRYKVGALLLDLKDPTKVLHRAKSPVLEPDQCYENSGFKPGVVYAVGSAVVGGTLFLYYGASDSYICVAHTNLNEFLKELLKDKGKKLTLEPVEKDVV
ncbi:hypothetical protein JXA34_01830 [Patescibacteria group bacterium]|nr:hypothetical protein [Patescibacteria group bacterium]